jgi:indolepyruvate ferredoxin oxidoreductase beta subunit
MKLDVLIVGVGGQGTVFFSSILSSYAISKNLNVAGIETVGAAQRGGSVSSHCRISSAEIFSPMIPPGNVDILLGFEEIEMLRALKLASDSTVLIQNSYRIPTAYTMMGIDTYPSHDEVLHAARKFCPRVYVVDATQKAKDLGNPQSANAVMLGALSKVEPFFDKDEVRRCVQESSGDRACLNLRAFDEGYKLL